MFNVNLRSIVLHNVNHHITIKYSCDLKKMCRDSLNNTGNVRAT